MSDFIIQAGPCCVENEKVPMEVAEKIVKVLEQYSGIKYIFKSSFKKANRTRGDSFIGLEFDEAMRILQKVRETYQVPIITDVHETTDVKMVEPYVDYLQIPAFLCRQTDLVIEAAKSKPVSIKKGQFLSPQNMKHIVEKARSVGQEEVYVCERGTCFGYDTLVVDYSAFPLMRSYAKLIFDGTHSLQKQSAVGVTGGQRDLIPYMCLAAISVGIDGLFLEVHSDIDNAQSDKESQLEVDNFEEVIDSCLEILETRKRRLGGFNV